MRHAMSFTVFRKSCGTGSIFQRGKQSNAQLRDRLHLPQQHPLHRIQGFINRLKFGEQNIVLGCERAKRGIAPHQIEYFAKAVFAIDVPQYCGPKFTGVNRNRHPRIHMIENKWPPVAAGENFRQFGPRNGLVTQEGNTIGIKVGGFTID